MKKKILLVLLFLLPFFVSSTSAEVKKQEESEAGPFLQYFPLVYSTRQSKIVGPMGGNIESLVIDPIDPDIMYAGSWGSGVFKTVDGGISWTPHNVGITNPYIYSLAIDPVDHNKIYAGTYGAGVFKSYDGGENWMQICNGLYMPAVVYVITVDKNNPNVVYAGTRNANSGTYGFKGDYNSYGGGIFKSTNGGLSWGHASIADNDDYVYDIKIDPTNSNIVYAAMHWWGVFKSYDAGVTWYEKNSGLDSTTDAQRTREIEIDPGNPQRVYLATWGDPSFFYSNNGGENWYPRNSGLPYDAKIWELTMDPLNPQTIYASTMNNGLWKTVDGGNLWSPRVYLSPFHNTLAVMPNNSSIVIAGVKEKGLWKSTNGGRDWSVSHNGIQAHNIVSALNDPNDPGILYVSAYGDGVWKSIDNGTSWNRVMNGLPDEYVNTIIFRPGNSNSIFAGTYQSGVYATINGGANWSSVNNGIPVISRSDDPQALTNPVFAHPTSLSWYQEFQEDLLLDALGQSEIQLDRSAYPSIYTIAISSSNPDKMLVGTSVSALRSLDGGNSWQTTEYTMNTPYYASIFDPGTTVRAYMGLNYERSAIKTEDSTLWDWEKVNVGILGQRVNSFIFDSTGTNIIYAGTSDDPGSATIGNGVYKSINYGATWSFSGLVNSQVNSMLNFPTSPGWILAGTTGGLFISKDKGATWSLYDPSILNQTINHLSQGFGENLVLMATDGGNLVLIKR